MTSEIMDSVLTKINRKIAAAKTAFYGKWTLPP